MQNIHCSFLQYLSVQFTSPLGPQEHRLQLSPLGKFSPTLYCFPLCSQTVKYDSDLYACVIWWWRTRASSTNNAMDLFTLFFFLLIYTNSSKTEHQEIGIIFFCLKFANGFKTRFWNKTHTDRYLFNAP